MTLKQHNHFPHFCIAVLQLLTTVFFFIGTSRCLDDDLTLTVTTGRSEVHAGDNVTLICRVQGASESARFEWYKMAVAGDETYQELISSNEELSVLYSQQPGERYDVQAVRLPEVTLYILHVYLVKNEDSGRYRCAMLYGGKYTGDPDVVSLVIYKRPRSVYFDGYPNGSELTVVEDVPNTLTCVVAEVLPQPHVSIHVHHRSLGSHLPRNVSVNVRCPPPPPVASSFGGSRPGKKFVSPEKVACGPVHYDMDVAVTTTQMTATYRDDGHRVTCSVNLASANWTPADASIYLNVKYRPRFNCSQSLSVLLGARDVSIRCRLRYNPRPSFLSVRWRLGDDVNTTTLDAGTSITDEYQLHETVVDLTTWKETELIFVIGQVRKEHFGIYYHFDAANDVGSSTHGVRLLQYHPPRTSTVSVTTTRYHHHFSKPVRSTPGDVLPAHPNGGEQHVGPVRGTSHHFAPNFLTNVFSAMFSLTLTMLLNINGDVIQQIPHR